MTDFCKDCKHIELGPHKDQLEFAKCGHPNSVTVTVDLVSGVETRDALFCSIARTSVLDDRCGEDGDLFEAAACPVCEGSGEEHYGEGNLNARKCPECHGTGEAE
jgi:hypothetical protein